MNEAVNEAPGFWPITVPIFFDNFMRMLVVVLSYWVVSRISDAMAAVIGVTNAFLLIGFGLAECLAQSSGIIIAQLLGAKKEETLSQAYVSAIGVNLVFGIAMSCLFVFFSTPLLSAFSFPDSLLSDASRYLCIVASGFFVYSLNYSLMSILNANGLTRVTMWNSFISNGLTLFLGYMIVLNPFGLNYNKLTFLALSHLIVRLLSFGYLSWMTKCGVQHFVFYRRFSKGMLQKQVQVFLRIGIPNSFEPLSYHFFQLVLLKIVAIISLNALSTRSYIISLAALMETGAFAVAKGSQIVMGHLIGAGKMQQAKEQLNKSLFWALGITLLITWIGLLFRSDIMCFFSKNHSIVAVGSQLLFLVAAIALMRAISYSLSSGLKASGDVKYCVGVVTLTMWLITIPGSFFLIKFFGMDLRGIWIMFGFEEMVRILMFYRRWRSEKWQHYSVV
jgi:putative MATE family efflux protein